MWDAGARRGCCAMQETIFSFLSVGPRILMSRAGLLDSDFFEGAFRVGFQFKEEGRVRGRGKKGCSGWRVEASFLSREHIRRN